MSNLKKKNLHPTKSFDQMVSDAQISRLKPYIQQQVGLVAEQIANTLYQSLLQERAQTQTRQLAFERLLKANCQWFNDDVLALAIAEVEDEAEHLETVQGEIVKGDKVRLAFQAQPHGAAWSGVSKLAIHSVTTKGPNGEVQTHKELEEAVLGMKAGETKEFAIPEVQKEGDEPENTLIKVTVMKVSRKPQAPEVVSEN